METNNNTYEFDISLSVLEHLGRNLYRNFITVLGEAISNSWDADAKNVWIEIDRKNNHFTIKDDGVGMTPKEFETKFLKIGYSKRTQTPGQKPCMFSPGGRPYIGAKGIGKLALLSCSKTVGIISKTSKTNYTGGMIDNERLDVAVEDDKPYKLGEVDQTPFEPYKVDHNHGTIIQFKNVNEGIQNTIPNLRKMIALYFRFSLIDNNFKIHLNGKEIVLKDLQKLFDVTQFLWCVGNFNDPFIDNCGLAEGELLNIDNGLIEGFIANVDKPRKLKIPDTEERLGVDLFVNGRLRERDLLKHIPTARVAESYMFGQIHFNALDSNDSNKYLDRFTSSREGVLESDGKYQSLLTELKSKIIPQILTQWNGLREKKNDDDEKTKILILKRARSLHNLVAKKLKGSTKLNKWIKDLEKEAEFNISAYAEYFLLENILRKYVADEKIDFKQSDDIKDKISKNKGFERRNRNEGYLNIEVRKDDGDLNYLDMGDLAKLVDPPPAIIKKVVSDTMVTDVIPYRPLRNAVAHTAFLTTDAKNKLETIYTSVKAKIKALIAEKDKSTSDGS